MLSEMDSWHHIGEVLEGYVASPRQTGIAYDPPYDSPLEDNFARCLIPHLSARGKLHKQVGVSTICGRFIFDFVASLGDRKVAFECDGKEFHNPHRDEWRDAMILGAKAVAVIYRMRGGDLTYHLADSLYLISRYEPQLFTADGLRRLQAGSSAEARSYKPSPDQNIIQVTYKDSGSLHSLLIERKLQIPPQGIREHWQYLFSYAAERNGGNLDEVMKSYRGGVEHGR